MDFIRCAWLTGRHVYALGCLFLVALLSSCMQKVPQEPVPQEQTPRFEVCAEALALPDAQRAFQGLDGWFFFNYDLKEAHEMMTPEQVAFIAKLNRVFANKGILLVVPVPNRGAVRPEALYLADPKQAAFSPASLRANFDAFVQSLEQQGVATVNVLAEAIAFDASGGQTFFKRDLHWTPEGANMIAKVVASKISDRLAEPLPQLPFVLTRNPNDQTYTGLFINHWIRSACGYGFPPEPLGDYTVTSPATATKPVEVVQLGSSHSKPPFDKGFLSVALQSPVANMAVGNGGVFFSLENYLASDDYLQAPPTVLVWEFPASAAPIDALAQRRLLAASYGICSGTTKKFERTVSADDPVLSFEDDVSVADTYLTFSFSDLSLLNFKAILRYGDGQEETLAFDRPEQIAEFNQGRFFTTLLKSAQSLEAVSLQVMPERAGTVKVQLCQTP